MKFLNIILERQAARESSINEGWKKLGYVQKNIRKIFGSDAWGVNEDDGFIEVIVESGYELGVDIMKKLNRLGLIYTHEQTNIEYEDVNGEPMKYMDIYYFKAIKQ